MDVAFCRDSRRQTHQAWIFAPFPETLATVELRVSGMIASQALLHDFMHLRLHKLSHHMQAER
jgi:hypothetical protein